MKVMLTGLVVVLLVCGAQGAERRACSCYAHVSHTATAAHVEQCCQTRHTQHAGAAQRRCCAQVPTADYAGLCCSACVRLPGQAQALPPEATDTEHRAESAPSMAAAWQAGLLAQARGYAWPTEAPAAGLPPPELTVISSIVLLI